MKSIRIEGDEEIRLSRIEYDLRRRENPSCRAVCHAPFVSLDLRATGVVTPCRYSVMDLGRVPGEDIESVWNGQGFRELRKRFGEYHVRYQECYECVDPWLEGIPEQSPALVEFDGLPLSEKDRPEIPSVLSLDLRTEVPTAVSATLALWLPDLKRLDLTLYASQLDNCRILSEVLQIPVERRPRITVHIPNAIPEAGSIPISVNTVELSLNMNAEEGLASQEEGLRALAQHLRSRGTGLLLKVEVHQGNWINLRSWVLRARHLGIPLVPGVAPAREWESLANLDGDALGIVHNVCQRWFYERLPNINPRGGSESPDAFLARLRHWQNKAARREPQRDALALPHFDHSLLRDEVAFEQFLGDLLRIYDDPRVQEWLTKLIRGEGYIEQARQRRSIRLAALWLGCVFNHTETLLLLREVFRTQEGARRIIEEDRRALADTPWEGWLDIWTNQLGLKSLQPRVLRFEIGTPVPGTAKQPTKITVIVPSYNHETFIADAIRSVLSQTRTVFRVLVVDDASGDGTVQEAQKIQDPRILVTRNARNLGLGRSLARALDAVETEFVAILNSDDLYHPRRLESCLAALEANSQWEIVATGVFPIDHKGRICSLADSSAVFDGPQMSQWLRWDAEHTRRQTPPKDIFKALLERNFLLSSSNIVARTNFLRQHRELWQGLQFCLDWQLFLVAALERKLCYLPEPLLGYRLHSSNTVWFDSGERWLYYLEANQVIARILDQLFQRNEELREQEFIALLDVMTGSMNANTNIDWPGVLVGLFLERLRLQPRDLEGSAFVEKLQMLERRRDLRHQIDIWVRQFGVSVPKLYRMQGEYVFLRSVRNSYEALKGDSERLHGELLGLLFDRANAEKWWHKAEEERDRKIAEVSQLYRQIERKQVEIGGLQSALETNRAELQAARQESDNLLQTMEAKCDTLKGRVQLLTTDRNLLQTQFELRTAERDALLHSEEYRVGNYLLNLANRLYVRKPLNLASWLFAASRQRLTVWRLAVEGRVSAGRHGRLRAVTTVCTGFPIYSQTFVYQEITQLAQNGFDVRLVYSKLDSRDLLHAQFAQLWGIKRRLSIHWRIHKEDFEHYRARMPEKVENLITKLCEASGLARQDLVSHDNFLQAFSFTKMVESYRPHYLHSYFFYDRSLMALVASFLLGIPRGMSCYADHLLKDYEFKLVPLHLQLCDLVIATSERIKKELLEIAPDTDANKILVKANAINGDRFPFVERQEPRAGEPFRLACICRIEPKKGLLYLVEAVGLLRQSGWRVELHLVGAADEVQASQDYKRKVDQQITKLGLWGTVHLEGRQNEGGVLRFLHISHLFVAPFVETETGDKDGIPTAVLEAMATGLPIVATNAGSTSEVLDDGLEGILVPQRDTAALVQAIEALLRDPRRRRDMGKAAAQKIRRDLDVRVCEKSFHDRVRAMVKARV